MATVWSLMYRHEPEHIPGQERRDTQLGRSEFYVYVLATDFGHYVGHTWNVRLRLAQHQRDEVASTAGSNPRLLWWTAGPVYSPFSTRLDAARFEAALKTWRDSGDVRFRGVVGVDPIAWMLDDDPWSDAVATYEARRLPPARESRPRGPRHVAGPFWWCDGCFEVLAFGVFVALTFLAVVILAIWFAFT